MNSVNLIGRITKDLELRYTESKIPCVSMFVALNNGKDEEGNERPADFPKVYVYNKQAENVSKYCKKGSLVGIEGRIKTRNYEKEDGSKVYETYVIANRVQFLETKSSDNAPLPELDYSPKEANDPFANADIQTLTEDDELPF